MTPADAIEATAATSRRDFLRLAAPCSPAPAAPQEP
jgi:hypothetical protein